MKKISAILLLLIFITEPAIVGAQTPSSSEDILLGMVEAMSKAQTAETKVKFFAEGASPKYKFKQNEAPKKTKDKVPSFGLELNGVYERTGTSTGSATITITTASDIQKKSDRFAIDANIRTNKDRIKLGGEIRVVDKVLYMALTKAEGKEMQGMGSFVNQWISIDQKALTKDLDKELRREVGAVKTPRDLTAEQKKEIYKSMLTTGFLRVQSAKQENESWHFVFKIDGKKIDDFIVELNSITEEKETLSSYDRKQMEKTFSRIAMPPIHLWVNSNTLLPEKIIADGSWNTIKKSSWYDQEVGSTGKYHISINYTSWNASLAIDKPKNATDYTQMLTNKKSFSTSTTEQ